MVSYLAGWRGWRGWDIGIAWGLAAVGELLGEFVNAMQKRVG